MAWQYIEKQDISYEDSPAIRYVILCEEGNIFFDINSKVLLVHVEPNSTKLKAFRELLWEGAIMLCEKYNFKDVYLLTPGKFAKLCKMLSKNKAELLAEKVILGMDLYIIKDVV